jgi:hypothetical protein
MRRPGGSSSSSGGMRRPGGSSSSSGGMRRPGGGNSGGGSVSQEWLPDPTGNKTWEYQLRDCKWVARKKGKTTEYIISDVPKYQSSVDILNNAYPDLIKKCKDGKPEENKPEENKPEENKPEETKIVLPSWADCIKTLPGEILITTSSDKEEILMYEFGNKDKSYFFSAGTFIYIVTKTNERIYGEWSCVNGKLFIDTEDGQQWTKATGWVDKVSKNKNPERDYGGGTPVYDVDISGTPDSSDNIPKMGSSVDDSEFTESIKLEMVISEIDNLIKEEKLMWFKHQKMS